MPKKQEKKTIRQRLIKGQPAILAERKDIAGIPRKKGSISISSYPLSNNSTEKTPSPTFKASFRGSHLSQTKEPYYQPANRDDLEQDSSRAKSVTFREKLLVGPLRNKRSPRQSGVPDAPTLHYLNIPTAHASSGHASQFEHESAQMQIHHLLLPTVEQAMRSRLNTDIEFVIKEEGSTGGLSIGMPPDSLLYSSRISSSVQS